MAIKRQSKELPADCLKAFRELVELVGWLDERCTCGEAAGVEMQDAIEISTLAKGRLEQIRLQYYPNEPSLVS